MAGTVKYNSDYHDNWAWSLAVMGATTQQIADAMQVSEKTIDRWIQTHESFAKAVREGKAASDSKVIRSLYERATGYDYEERVEIVEIDNKTGETKPVKVEKLKKHEPPNVTAMIFWLKNRQRDRWRDRPEQMVEADELPQVHIYLPDNGRDSNETIIEAKGEEIRDVEDT